MGNIQAGEVILDNLKYVHETIEDLPDLYLETNEILFNRTNSWELVGKTGVYKGPPNKFTFASYLIRVRTFTGVDPDFVNLGMNAPFYRKTQINPTLTQQCGQANFNGTKMKNSLVPVAPSAEQKRIVSKVSVLLSQLDELSTEMRSRQSTTDALLTALVHQILEEAK